MTRASALVINFNNNNKKKLPTEFFKERHRKQRPIKHSSWHFYLIRTYFCWMLNTAERFQWDLVYWRCDTYCVIPDEWMSEMRYVTTHDGWWCQMWNSKHRIVLKQLNALTYRLFISNVSKATLYKSIWGVRVVCKWVNLPHIEICIRHIVKWNVFYKRQNV